MALRQTNSSPLASLRHFHEDEDGMEALQVVMIVAIGAVVLLFIKSFWGRIKTWANNLIQNITSWTS